MDSGVINLVLEVFLQFTFHIIAFFLMCEPKYGKRKTVVIMVSATIIGGTLLIVHCGSNLNMLNYFFLYYLAAIFYYVILFLVLFEGNIKKKLFLFITYANIFFLCLVIPIKISFLLKGYYAISAQVIRYFMYAGIFFVYKKQLKKNFETLSDSMEKEWADLILMATIIFIIFSYKAVHFGIYMLKEGVTSLYEDVLLFLLAIISYVIAFRMISSQIENFSMKQKIKKNQLLLEQIKEQEVYLENAKRMRHDFRHYNLVILDYLHKKDYQSLENCVKDYEEAQEEMNVHAICKNKIINSILQVYRAKADNLGISTDFSVKVPTQIAIKDYDLIAILGNALENAINACKESYKQSQKIEVRIHIKNNKLIILVRNTCKDSIIFEDHRPKTKGESTGITSMIASAKCYKGSVDFSVEKTLFSSRIILNL